MFLFYTAQPCSSALIQYESFMIIAVFVSGIQEYNCLSVCFFLDPLKGLEDRVASYKVKVRCY